MKDNKDYVQQLLADQQYADDRAAFDSIARHFAERETKITEFISLTVDNHKKRWGTKIKYQKFITNMLIVIVITFAAALLTLIVLSCCKVIDQISVVITLVSSAGLTFIGSIFSLLNIVVKYMFPEKEEEYSMGILKNASDIDYRYYENKTTKEEYK